MNVRSFPEEAHSNKIILITSLVSGLTIKARVAICFSTCFIFIYSESQCSPRTAISLKLKPVSSLSYSNLYYLSSKISKSLIFNYYHNYTFPLLNIQRKQLFV